MRTGNTGDGFFAGKIGNVDKSIVEASVEVGNTKYELAFSDLRAERYGSLLLGRLSLLWCLRKRSYVSVILCDLPSIQPKSQHPALYVRSSH